MFSENQLVVYPAQGVGQVERIESQEIGGTRADFYIVRIISNNVTLMVPVANAENVGLRSVCAVDEGRLVLESLKDRSDFMGYSGQNWNRRYREYSEKLKSGELGDVSYVLKELILIGRDKELSFGERRLLEQAMSLITMEIAYAMDMEQDAVRKEIEEIFADILKRPKLNEDNP